MNASRRAVALTAAGVVGARSPRASASAPASTPRSRPSTTTTTVVQSSGTGRGRERLGDRAGRRSRSTTIYQRTHQGVVDITVVGTQPAAAHGRGLGLGLRHEGRHRHEPARRRGGDVDHRHVLERRSRTRRTLVGSDSSTDLAVVRISAPSSRADAARARQLGRRPGRRPGGRDRQPVRPLRDRHERHRQRPPPLDRRAEQLHDRRTRSRPTRRSTTATPAARC